MLFLIERLAKALIDKYKPQIICITGSVGKTSTRNAIVSVLSKTYRVRATPKNLNNRIGVPLSIIGDFNFKSGITPLLKMIFRGLTQMFAYSNFPNILVLEVGAGKVGDINKTCKWLRPDFLVITNLPDQPSHLGVFGSKEAVIREKKHLAQVMNFDSKLLIDEHEASFSMFVSGFKGQIITYNFARNSDDISYEIIYDNVTGLLLPKGIELIVQGLNGGDKKLVYSDIIGLQNIKAIVPAIVLAKQLLVSDEELIEGLRAYQPEPGRLRLLRNVKHNYTVIDDSYNASPLAVLNSLQTFIALKINKDQRKIAILGDMLNLGSDSKKIHSDTAVHELSQLDVLITVGDDSEIWQSHNCNTLSYNKHFKNATNAALYAKLFMQPGDLILCKGGYLLRLEKAVKILSDCGMENIVRQEDYWQKKKYELYDIDCDR